MGGVRTPPAGTLPEPVALRPSGVRVLAVITWVLLLVFVALTVQDDLGAALRFAPFAALVALVVYALFWRPCVRVDADGVTLTNVVRDVRIPFSRLQDVRTRFALTLETVEGTFTSWASPAPGRTSAMTISRRETKGFQAMGQATDQGVSASAAPNTDSGAAALLVRHRWDVWLEHGGSVEQDDGRIERTWDVPLVCALAVLGALSALAAVL
jgi:hypothetical protein